MYDITATKFTKLKKFPKRMIHKKSVYHYFSLLFYITKPFGQYLTKQYFLYFCLNKWFTSCMSLRHINFKNKFCSTPKCKKDDENFTAYFLWYFKI